MADAQSLQQAAEASLSLNDDIPQSNGAHSTSPSESRAAAQTQAKATRPNGANTTTSATQTPSSSTSHAPASAPPADPSTPNPSTAGPTPPSAPTDLDILLSDLNRHPLFMTSLDPDTAASNPELDAIRALAYEGTKSEVAANFRNQGNDLAKQKSWKDADEFYIKALDVIEGRTSQKRTNNDEEKQKKVVQEDNTLGGDFANPNPSETIDLFAEGGPAPSSSSQIIDIEAETAQLRAVQRAAHTNRALCNLHLQNHRTAVLQAAAALKLDPQNLKAYFRAASALLAIDKPAFALQAVDAGLSRFPESRELADVRKRIRERDAFLRKQEEQRRERETRRIREAQTLRKAFADRGIRSVTTTGSRDAKPDLEDAEARLADPLDEASELVLPVLLLYPTEGESELIKGVKEGETLGEHLAYVLPVPWDEGGKEFGGSDGSGVVCFMETGASSAAASSELNGGRGGEGGEGKRGLVKVGKKMNLGDVLSDGRAEVTDGLCRVYVVPVRKVGEWVEEMKRRMGRA
ncbi:MAG: hypothetical protein M1831_005648 [Alyxoria varia]|nr:MAG: hypothetical protein M1831_005648 [Alyxoria varia]